ncbi:PLC-like phosphodiesterase [Pseudoneurospora amorphoporcata]|uniref:PLC-like phosphodiesterase n=1 Tax=Pseudoneurospora amorphoporcata TaxID=241081 RepID=A0AAN6SHL9_9PEZI|nr:PLC-like phosphodiesterase [Pseudoneurospora amorphoporcata]
MHREPKPSRAILSAPFPPSPPHLPSPAVAASSTPSSSRSPRRFKHFRSLLPTTTTSYRAVLSSVCIMAVLFWVVHLLFFSLFPDFTTGNPSTSPSSPIPPPSSPQEEPSVADLALQKILKDSRQILGPFPSSFNKSAAAKRRAQWMTPLPDSLPLTSLKAIPGTHDSATWNFTQATRDVIPSNPSYLPADWFRCQKKSIVESLEAGIRFFDLRYAALEDGGTKGEEGMRLVFWHKMALLSEVATVEDVLFGFYGWLETRGKGETVLISLQYEHPTRSKASNTPQVQRLLHSTLTTSAARRFIYPSHSLPPTLGHARGKIVLLKRFELPDLSLDQQLAVPGLNFSPSIWPENNKGFELVYNQLDLGPGEGEGKKINETAYIEDYFEPNDLPNKMNGSVEENVAAKWEAVEEHLRSAAAASQTSEGEDDGLWITFTSGEHVLNEPNITPEVMALGPEEQRRGQPARKVDGGKGGGRGGTVKGGVNEKLLGLLKEGGPDGLKGKRLGVVVMDFWEMEGEGDLIGALLGLD